MLREQKIKTQLTENLNPEYIEVINNSHLHQGHTGDDGSMETHYKIVIESKKLENLKKIEAHKKIYKILQTEFDQGLHALEISINN